MLYICFQRSTALVRYIYGKVTVPCTSKVPGTVGAPVFAWQPPTEIEYVPYGMTGSPLHYARVTRLELEMHRLQFARFEVYALEAAELVTVPGHGAWPSRGPDKI